LDAAKLLALSKQRMATKSSFLKLKRFGMDLKCAAADLETIKLDAVRER